MCETGEKPQGNEGSRVPHISKTSLQQQSATSDVMTQMNRKCENVWAGCSPLCLFQKKIIRIQSIKGANWCNVFSTLFLHHREDTGCV